MNILKQKKKICQIKEFRRHINITQVIKAQLGIGTAAMEKCPFAVAGHHIRITGRSSGGAEHVAAVNIAFGDLIQHIVTGLIIAESAGSIQREIRIRSTVDVREQQKKLDALSKDLRELDVKIQGLNWTTDLIE